MGWLIPAALFTVLGALGSSQAPDNTQATLPNVRPIAVWLQAVKDADHEALKTVFSERMRRQFDAEGWDRVVRTYQEVLKKEFGDDYRLEDFSFDFKGDENRGTVSVVYNGRTLPALRVVKEKNEWKIDER